MPRPEKPTKILPDNLNMALRVAAAAELRPKNAGAFVLMPKEAAGLVGGILSLVAERDARKQELEALRNLREAVSGCPPIVFSHDVRRFLSQAVQAKP